MNSSTASLQKIRQFDLPVAILLVLLGCVLFFFSFDRQIVSILKTTLMHEMNVSNTDYSLLITAFMLPYTIMYFFSGVLVDRYGSRFVITGLMVLMAAATLITGLATSLNGLLAGRVLLGMAESGIVPALTLAVFTWFKAPLYRLALGVLHSGLRRGCYRFSVVYGQPSPAGCGGQ